MQRNAFIAACALSAVGLALAQTAPAPTVTDIAATPARLATPLAAPVANPVARRARPATAATIVPANTPIRLQLETHLSTRFNKYGDGFAARVMTSVFYQGQEVIPSGAILEGHVMRVQDSRPAVSDSALMLKPDLLTMPDGQKYVISAMVVQSDAQNPARVNAEGELQEPRGMMASDIHHAEAGIGGGIVGGALLAGAQGAAVGAGVGAAVAAGVWLVRHRHLELNPGSQLTVKLERPLQLTRQ
ncbi:MAG TPA: hypothetical protein VNE83_06165 [Terriglobales bacterium]|nr:hypothetical protein [Terriglobales bacterium]